MIDLYFNNSDIGEISSYIKNRYYNENDKLYKIQLNIKNDIILNVFKYKNPFIFILNEVKDIFYIYTTGYNIVSIDGIKYVIYENNNNVPLSEYSKNCNFKGKLAHLELQRVFAFNWLMCLNSNYENKIYVFPNSIKPFLMDMKTNTRVSIASINEQSFTYDTNKGDISKNIIKQWFNNSMEEFYEIIGLLIMNIDIDALRQELIKIVNRYDNNYISWVNSVYERMINIKQQLKN